jgi:sedoheptulose-bisphosphatase
LQLGDSLAEFLVEATPDPKLRQLMMSMSEAIRTIAYKVWSKGCLTVPRGCWAAVWVPW